MMNALQRVFPFAPAPSIQDAQTWGVWNRRQRCWAEPPGYSQDAAERIAAAMVDAYAAASARPGARGARPPAGLRFRPEPHANVAWGVWDRARERWAERALYDLEYAERIAAALNEAYAAGLADVKIGEARLRLRRRTAR